AVGLTRADLLDPQQRAQIQRRVARLAPRAAWLEIVQRPSHLRNCRGQTQPLTALEGQPIAAFCGIGNPRAFEQALRQAEYRLVDFQVFPDHHAYDSGDLAALARRVVHRRRRPADPVHTQGSGEIRPGPAGGTTPLGRRDRDRVSGRPAETDPLAGRPAGRIATAPSLGSCGRDLAAPGGPSAAADRRGCRATCGFGLS
ncbi:MAG: hypothetical protein GTO03_15560, partial [Planctomycetales bacterium]|nr:hypothetical protein [Planctomycetales bacterium]